MATDHRVGATPDRAAHDIGEFKTVKIESAAGEFAFDIESMTIDGDTMVLLGKMGVWDAKTRLTRADLLKLLGLTVGSFRFWGFALRLPGYALRRRFGRQKDEGETPS